jgi:hypothetical protein
MKKVYETSTKKENSKTKTANFTDLIASGFIKEKTEVLCR